METGKQLLNVLFLLFLAVRDHRRRMVPVLPCILYTVFGMLMALCRGEKGALLLAGTCLAGQAALLVIPWPFAGTVGAGDLLVILSVASTMGILQTLQTTFLALLAASGYALFLLLCKRADRKTTFPFVPFLLAGQILYWIGSDPAILYRLWHPF